MQSQPQIGNRTVIFRLLAIQSVLLVAVGFLSLYQIIVKHDDLKLYYQYSLKMMQGLVPYRDFPIEYPPLALPPFILPWLAALGQPLSLTGYNCLFMLENLLLSILMGLLLLPIAKHLRLGRSSAQVLKVYVLLVAIAAPLLPWRYDLFPALLTQLALLFVLINRPTLAGIWLGLGITAKLYPILFLPIFGAYYLTKREYRGLLRLLLGSLGAVCLSLLPFALMAGEKLLFFLGYHQTRGLQIESIPAGAIALLSLLRLTEVKKVSNYGSHNLVSPLGDSVLQWLPWVFILAFVVVIASCLFYFRSERVTKGTVIDESLVAYLVLTILTFIATGKVFSPQYIIWLLPFGPLLRPRQVGVLIAIFAMTIAIFPLRYDLLLTFHPIGVLLLNLRNLLVVILLFWLLVEHLPASVSVAFMQLRRLGFRLFTK